MNGRHAFVIVVVLLAAFCGCRQKVTFHPINLALKKAFNYQVGSYWIYKDSITGVIDSLYVTSSVYGAFQINNNPLEMRDLLGIDFSVNDGNSSHIEKWAISAYENIFEFHKFGSGYDGVENIIGEEMPLDVPFPFTDTTSWSESDSFYVRILPTFNVNSKVYTNTVLISLNNDYRIKSTAMYNDLFYIDTAIGIVKFVFNHESDSILRIMVLQRYHVIK